MCQESSFVKIYSVEVTNEPTEFFLCLCRRVYPSAYPVLMKENLNDHKPEVLHL